VVTQNCTQFPIINWVRAKF